MFKTTEGWGWAREAWAQCPGEVLPKAPPVNAQFAAAHGTSGQAAASKAGPSPWGPSRWGLRQAASTWGRPCGWCQVWRGSTCRQARAQCDQAPGTSQVLQQRCGVAVDSGCGQAICPGTEWHAHTTEQTRGVGCGEGNFTGAQGPGEHPPEQERCGRVWSSPPCCCTCIPRRRGPASGLLLECAGALASQLEGICAH